MVNISLKKIFFAFFLGLGFLIFFLFSWIFDKQKVLGAAEAGRCPKNCPAGQTCQHWDDGKGNWYRECRPSTFEDCTPDGGDGSKKICCSTGTYLNPCPRNQGGGNNPPPPSQTPTCMGEWREDYWECVGGGTTCSPGGEIRIGTCPSGGNDGCGGSCTPGEQNNKCFYPGGGNPHSCAGFSEQECKNHAGCTWYVPPPPPPPPTSTPTVTPPVSPSPTGYSPGNCSRKNEGDANCDGRVDMIDYSLWLNSQCRPGQGQTCADLKADFDNDKDVDDDDLKIWLRYND